MNIDQNGSSRFLYTLIDKFPGLYFREISNASGFSVGTLDYNLRKLKKSSFIADESIWGKKKYFSSSISSDERKIIGLLREENVRRIIGILQEHEAASCGKISSYISLSKPTISWYIKRLKTEGLLETGCGVALRDRKAVESVLLKYRPSFSDKLLNNFISMWER
jgi:predicted transcriptional regulator